MGTLDIPIFTLRTVLFPGGVLPLRVFEQRYMDMIKNCIRDSRSFGVCLIKEGPEVGEAAVPEDVGCLAKVTDWEMPQLGILDISTVGQQRFRILKHWATNSHLVMAQVLLVPEEPAQSLPAAHQVCATVIQQVVQRLGGKNFLPPHKYHDAVWVGYRLAEVLLMDIIEKQHLLEMQDSLIRIHRLHQILQKQGLVH
jgi:Lon protease-like protein